MVGDIGNLDGHRCPFGDGNLPWDSVGRFLVWHVGPDAEFPLENRAGGIPGVLCASFLSHHAAWSSVPENRMVAYSDNHGSINCRIVPHGRRGFLDRQAQLDELGSRSLDVMASSLSIASRPLPLSTRRPRGRLR